jgi:hypothetical protein
MGKLRAGNRLAQWLELVSWSKLFIEWRRMVNFNYLGNDTNQNSPRNKVKLR